VDDETFERLAGPKQRRALAAAAASRFAFSSEIFCFSSGLPKVVSAVGAGPAWRRHFSFGAPLSLESHAA
jgi:hypothetical protein